MPFNILVVDDHRIMRDGLRAILKLHPDFQVVAEAKDGNEAMHYLRNNPVDVVLMDIKFPSGMMTGVEVTQEMLKQHPETRVVILSMHDEEDLVMDAMRAGARGFVLKRASEGDLVDALRTVSRGGSYLSPEVSDKLLKRLQNGNVNSRASGSALDGLSPRELQVMRMVAEGKTSKEIAVTLDLGLQTIRSYRKTMMKKLGVSNVAGLTQFALANGVTQLQGHESMNGLKARSHHA